MTQPHDPASSAHTAANRGSGRKIYMWQNLMCLTYLMIFKQMEDFFLANDCEIVDDPRRADWILIGACGAFYHQIDNFFDRLEDFSQHDAKIVVYGCLPRISPSRYSGAKRHVEFYIDTRRPEGVEKIVSRPKVPWRDVPAADGFRMIDYRKFDPKKKYVVIQQGCNSKCVFCPHIKGIGPQESLPRKRVIADIKRLLDGGADTLLIEGRDAGSWGTDLEPAETYPDLLEEILGIDKPFKLCLNQLGANWVIRYQDRLLGLLLDSRVVDVHIPIQTVSDRLLELMGREPGVGRLSRFLASVRGRNGNTVLRTDMLIGFPTETDDEFTETLHFINEYFDEVAYYGFELHPNTKVATMGLPPHDRELIEKRVETAQAFIERNPYLVWHRGGQKPMTMMHRERHKDRLNRI